MSSQRSTSALRMSVVANHEAASHFWSERLGIEYWSMKVLLSGFAPGLSEEHHVVIVEADIWRVDHNLCLDPHFDLDCTSIDLGRVAWAIVSSEETLSEWSIAAGMNCSYVIADLVLVDKHWRGRRIGPALVHFAADLLRVDATFLTPAALTTFVTPNGQLGTDYFHRRPGPEAQLKVRKAWRRAGFVKLTNGVVWTIARTDHGAAARAVFERLEKEANTASARAWWLRRIRRVAAASASTQLLLAAKDVDAERAVPAHP